VDTPEPASAPEDVITLRKRESISINEGSSIQQADGGSGIYRNRCEKGVHPYCAKCPDYALKISSS
jgi:hypothetical protein